MNQNNPGKAHKILQGLKKIRFPLLIALGMGGVLFLVSKFTFSPWVETEKTLIGTSMRIAEVHEIGELISAEYYGEVIHTLTESYQAEDSMAAEEQYEALKQAYTKWYAHYEFERVGKRIATETRIANSIEAVRNNLNGDGMYWYGAFRRLVPDETRLLETMRSTQWNEFSERFGNRLFREIRTHRQQTHQGVQLMYLGRGKVKAGVDLAGLSEHDFVQEGDSLLIYGLTPKILNADINPWLAPPSAEAGEGVKGFELLRESGTITPAMIERVKAGCKEELVRKALARGLLESAKSSAEQTLQQFFSVTNPVADSAINHVILMPGSLDSHP